MQKELLSLANILHARLELEKALGFQSLEGQKKPAGEVTPKEPAIHKKVETHRVKEGTPTYTKSSGDDRIEKLSRLSKIASTCTKCRLSKSRTKVVFGTGDPFTIIMFIGEGPGYDEDRQGEPFVGRAGQLLTKMIEAIKLKRPEVYIANMVKCRPPENRTPREDEVFTCTSNYLKYQIEWIRPQIICALGNVAAQGLLATKSGISLLRGRWHDYQGTKLLATFHPAYLLRNPQDKPKAWADLKMLRKMYDEVRGKAL